MNALRRLLDYPRFGPIGVNERMAKLCDGLDMVPSIKIVGSNGKGTTAWMMAHMAQSLGKSVGLYTSPHLLKVNERIQINGQMISDRDLDEDLDWALGRAASVEGTGRFEILTLAALYYFSRQNVDLAIMEVGLGGRFDPVRIAPGHISALTSIDLEHTAILGDTIEQIAAEKAAVCKKGDMLISAVGGLAHTMPEGVEYIDVSQPPLSPQQSNARLAAHALQHHFNLGQLPKTYGVRVPGRLQNVANEPPIYVDVAHNAQSVASVLDHFKGHPLSIICAFKSDKDLSKIAGYFHHVIALQFDEHMHKPEHILASLQADRKDEADNLEDALHLATTHIHPDGVIVCLGGFAIAGRALAHFQGLHYDVIGL